MGKERTHDLWPVEVLLLDEAEGCFDGFVDGDLDCDLLGLIDGNSTAA